MVMEYLACSPQHFKVKLVLLTGHVTCHVTFSGKKLAIICGIGGGFSNIIPRGNAF